MWQAQLMVEKKILVVDDEEGIRRVLRLSLSESGYRVLTAGTGTDALEIMRCEQPTVVLVDMIMPGMGGIELLRKIKEEKPDTEVILMTGQVDLESGASDLCGEAADFIAKPICYSVLEVVLKRIHGRSG
jgi:DNA-binding NtrC family response regulator